MNEFQSCEKDTKILAIAGGDTAITRQCLSARGLSYDRSTANKMLDEVKDGQSYPQNILDLLLTVTGDL